MAETNLIDQLNSLVEAILAGPRVARPAVDPDAAGLAAIAEELWLMPEDRFRQQLKFELLKAARQTGASAREKKEERTMAQTATAVSPVRAGFHTLTPYLVIDRAAAFIDFVKQAFGAEEKLRVPGAGGTLMHGDVKIGDSMLEMADANDQFPATPTGLHLYVEDADAVYQSALAAGATSLYAPLNQDYGDREAAVKDLSGNYWYIATRVGATPGHHIPHGLRSITPYLHTKRAPEFIEFLKLAFDGTELMRFTNEDGTIAHAKTAIGDSVLEMGEAKGQWQPMPATLHLYVSDADAVYRSALAAGASSIMEPKDQNYGDRSGGVLDAWGNRWFIATHIRDVAF